MLFGLAAMRWTVRAPSHIAYDPLWSMMQAAGVPVTLHIGSGQNMPSAYMNTGVERVLEGNLGNIETTKPKDLPVDSPQH